MSVILEFRLCVERQTRTVVLSNDFVTFRRARDSRNGIRGRVPICSGLTW